MNTDDNPAPPIPSESVDTALANQSLRGLRDLAAISLVVVLGPLLIYAFWRCLSNWGWWRVQNAGSGDEEGGRAANLRKQYVRTWHGWVERQGGGQNHEVQETGIGQTRGVKDPRALGRSGSLGWIIKDCLRPKTATTDHGRIFWGHQANLENGPIHPRYWWQKWLGGSRDRFNTPDEEKGISGLANSGFSLGENSTVRKRLEGGLPAAVWAAGSDKTRRATQPQPLPPRKCLRFTKGKPGQSKLVRVDDNVKAREGITRPRRCSSLPPGAVSKVQFPTPPFTRRLSAVLRRPGSVFEDTNPKKAYGFPEQITPLSQSLFKQRPIGEPEAPRNSIESPTSADVTPVPGAPSLRVEKQAALAYVDGSPTLTYEADFANSLGRRLEIWASPMLLDPLTPINHGIGGTAGRRASPAMGWREIQDRPEALYEDPNDYGAKYSSDLSIQSSDSSSTRDNLDCVQRGRSIAVGDGVLLTPSVSRDPILRHNIISNFVDERGCVSSVHPIQRRASFPAQYPSRVRARPDRTLHASVPRAKSVGSLTTFKPRISPAGKADESDRSQTRPFTSSEKAFLDLLDRKLNWLHHELSPGFRCPEDNPAESFRPTSGPLSRKTPSKPAQARISGTPGSGGESMLPRTSKVRRQKRVHCRIQNSKVDSWRIAMNNSRKGAHRSSSAELLRTILQIKKGAEQDPKEGTIDTAAWILRRPPQGWPTISKGSLSAAEKMIIKHQDWEKIRRPQRIMKQRHPRKNTIQLGRKISGSVLKALRIGSDATAMGDAVDTSKRSRRSTGENSRPVDENLPRPQLIPTTQISPNGVVLDSEPAPTMRGTSITEARSLGLMKLNGRRAISKG